MSHSSGLSPLSQITPSDGVQDWRRQFANGNNLQSTELCILQVEMGQLSDLLDSFLPNKARSYWTFQDLHDAVQQSRQEWQSKHRLGSGQPQRLFHHLMQKFDAHSDLLRVVPQSDMYTSLVTGVITSLVKASVNHSKTIEELSNVLDSVTESVALCDVESRLIQSELMQNAIAKLYIAIFLLFGDMIKWYNSSSLSKIRKSLHNDYSANFTSSLAKIQSLAANVRHVGQLGSQAEVRVVRTTVEEIREELIDFRAGLSGEVRLLAEFLNRQAADNLKQHQKTQNLLATAGSGQSIEYFRALLLEAAAPQAALTGHHHQSLEMAVLSTPQTSMSSSNPTHVDKLPQSIRNDTIAFRINSLFPDTDFPQTELLLEARPTPGLFDTLLANIINDWLASQNSCIRYLERLQKGQELTKLCTWTIDLCRSQNRPVIQHQQSDSGLEMGESITRLMLSISYQLISSLQPSETQPAEFWTCFDQLGTEGKDVGWENASAVLEAALRTAPSDLYIVLNGFPTGEDAATQSWLALMRRYMARDGNSWKMLIVSKHRASALVSLLEPSETKLVPRVSKAKGLVMFRAD